jgi:ABC-type glycerol-3-phosphate transport system substrate-binding protein
MRALALLALAAALVVAACQSAPPPPPPQGTTRTYGDTTVTVGGRVRVDGGFVN